MFHIAVVTDEIPQDLTVAAMLGKEFGSAAFPDGYEILKPWIVHIRLEDLKRTPEGKVEAVRLGTGGVDYLGQFKALRADGYSGYLSLETHWRVRPEIPEDSLHPPKGSVFSFGGEEATRLCFQSLQEMLV